MCSRQRQEIGGWGKSFFKEKCIKNNNGLGILYILECWDKDKKETFIKIGITSRSIKQRYNSKSSMPYNYKVLHEIIGSPEYIFDLETLLHNESKNYKYIPTRQFNGSSKECFKIVDSHMKNLSKTISSLTAT